MLLDEYIEIKVYAQTAEHYKSLGYIVPLKESSDRTKRRNRKEYVIDSSIPIKIKTIDLPKGSKQRVRCLCDVCGAETNIEYANYITTCKKNNGIYQCKDCGQNKSHEVRKNWSEEQRKHFSNALKQTMIERYGDDPFKNSIIQEKKRITNLQRRGVEFPTQNAEVKQKVKNTVIKHYGVEHVSQSDEIKQIIRNTNIERYGVPYTLQSSIVREKSRKTNLEKRGVEYPMQDPEVQNKAMKSYYKNSTMKSSKQQDGIYAIYKRTQKCELNYPISHCSGDIVFIDDMFDLEIDYNGHWLRVEANVMSEDEFNALELKREKVVKSQGYKVVRLISRNSRDIPTKSKLLEILNLTREYFNQYPKHTWINWDMDNSERRDAEHPDGIPFDFEELQKVK